VIFGETDAKAKAKFEEYKTWVSYEGAMALI
jgi:long-chain alkane monooxygenase